MSDAIVRPDDLRQFAASLDHFSQELRTNLFSLHQQFQALAETWRDQEQEAFAQIFQETAHTLQLFLEKSDEHIPFLLRKAEAAQAYIDQR